LACNYTLNQNVPILQHTYIHYFVCNALILILIIKFENLLVGRISKCTTTHLSTGQMFKANGKKKPEAVVRKYCDRRYINDGRGSGNEIKADPF